MQLSICQSCGVVIRNRGKHCTSCGVSLALNSPTQMPVFSQTRPPLEVSVKQDHLLIERVVNHRQLSVLSANKPNRFSYSTSSVSFDSPEADAKPKTQQGSNGGNGNGNGNGNGKKGGNGNGFGASGYVSKYQLPPGAPGVSEPPAQAPAEPEPKPSEKEAPAAKSPEPEVKKKPEESKSLTEFGSISIEEKTSSSGASPSSLMSSFSRKGLLGESKNQLEEEEKKSEVDTSVGSQDDWVGDQKEESQPSADSASKDKPDKIETVKKPDSKTQFLAQGIAGSAVSIAIGSAVSNSFKSTQAPKAPAVSEPQEKEPEVKDETSKQPEPQAQVASDQSAGNVSSGGFKMPTEVESNENVITSDQSITSEELDADKKVPPTILEPENKDKQSEDSGKEEKVPPIQTADQSDSSANGTDFDFAAQFGTDFNPEEFFNNTFDDAPKVGAEFENLPIKEPEPKKEITATPTDSESKKAVSDFFGNNASNADSGAVSIDISAASSAVDAASAGSAATGATAAAAAAASASGVASDAAATADTSTSSGAQPKGGFDFFDDVAQAKSKPYVQEANDIANVAKDDANTSQGGPATTIVNDDEDEFQRPMVAMPKGIKTKTVDDLETEEVKPEAEETESTSEDVDAESDSETEPEMSKAPKRRSFSGGSVKPEKQPDDDDEEDDDDEDSKLNWLEQEVALGSLNVTRQTAIVIVAVGAFILIQVPGWIMAFAGALTGGGGQQTVAQRPTMPIGGGQQMKQPGGNAAQSMSPLLRSRLGHKMQPQGQQSPMPVAGGQGQQAAGQGQTIIVGGTWRFRVFAGKQPYPADVVISQSGQQFTGQGRDGLGNFSIAGSYISPTKIQFNKNYDADAKRRGALASVITFYGELGQDQNGRVMARGAYKSRKKVGYEQSITNPAHFVPIGDKWEAEQVAQQKPEDTKAGMFAGIQNMFGGNKQPAIASASGPRMPKMGHKDHKSLQGFFLNIALCFIGVGVLIFCFFLFLFGPSGWMNIWEKKKYIPSQFKSQHLKMVRELGKPLQPGSVPFGSRLEWNLIFFWRPKYLTLPPDVREKNPHILMLGGSDKGKTRLMASMITHDIKSEDRAIVVIDSDGQLCDLVIEWIASQPNGEKFAKKVVLIDPTYKAGSLAYNPLEMPEDGDLQSAASAIVHGFKAIYTEPPGQQGGGQNQWNQQTANILRNAALLLMANGRTLTDLPNLLQDNDFRDIMLETVERRKSEKTEYINIIDTWNQYKKLARTDQWINWVEPILNRVGPMLGDGRIRPILTKPVSDLKLKDIILEKKILIVKVPQGELDQNANLLGSLIVTGLQQAAMSLGREKPHDIRPSALYLDDLDSFIEKETVEQLCAETKRYQVGFVGSIKTLQHLPEDFKSQLIINVGTMCVFALAKKDGDMLGPQMFRVDGRKIKHQTITNFFNKVNTSPQFELIMDEEKLNIDRIVGQEEQTYFCYRVGTVAGVFKLKAPDFKDIPRNKLNMKLIEKMHAVTDTFGERKK